MNAPEDQNGLREALARAEAERDAAVLREGQLLSSGMKALVRATAAEADAQYCQALLRAAEAEITRLKEGMEAADPRVIAAAWKAWHARHGGKLGPGPAFVEAIRAGFAALADPG